jgi:hypothetical protein
MNIPHVVRPKRAQHYIDKLTAAGQWPHEGGLRGVAEDENVPLADAVELWWELVPFTRGSSIADVLLMRALKELGMQVGDADPIEHVKHWKV